MTKSKILIAAAALSLTAGTLLSHTATAASFSIGDILRGGQAKAEGVEMVSAKNLDDNGNEAKDSEAGNDHGAGHESGESSDHGGNDHDSDGGSDHDSDGGSDHDSDGGSDD